MTQALPVSIETIVWKDKGAKIYVPKLVGFKEHWVMKKVNTSIEKTVRELIKWQHKKQGFSHFNQMIGMYEIKTNERHVLSISLSNYAIANHAANGLTVMKSLTFDLDTGEQKELKDLFKPGSNYVERISAMVSKQIEERDIPTLNSFTKIAPNQYFYVADKSLVIYFQALEITPHYVGLPMFPISLYSLEDMIRKNSVLERLLP